MPSLISGYEYDVFISYRQKDNVYDGWVTEFIDNLTRELEATFKEKISIYSDENIEDGLQEIHQVDESLSSKLKCLIFIPIVSQTYCDPESYAWKNEFLVFKELATEDPLGLKISLRSGNVVSRIVPVQIHNLDPHDKETLEGIIGGPLRSIDFIFRTPGVNRPLRADEDHAHDNLNKTYYRDQINKVANLIKEIILGIKSPGMRINPVTSEFTKVSGNAPRYKRLLPAVAVVSALLLVVYYFLMDLKGSISTQVDQPVTIAVLPFKVIGLDEESQYFADGIMDVILSNLTMFPELRVKSGTSVEKYRNSNKSVGEISRDLNVTYILTGSAQKIEENFRIVVQLVDTQTDITVWSEKFEDKFSNIFVIQNRISEAVARSVKARLTPDIAERIRHAPTSNFESYDLFLRARQLSRKYSNSRELKDLELAIRLLKRSLLLDAEFAPAYAWLAGLKTLRELGNISRPQVKDSILLLASTALAIDSTIVEAYLVLSELYYYEKDDVNAIRYTYKALDYPLGDSILVGNLLARLGSIYSRLGEEDKSLRLYDEILNNSFRSAEVLHQKFYPLAAGHRVDQLVALSKEITALQPDDPFNDLVMTHVWAERKDYIEIGRVYEKRKDSLANDMEWLEQYSLIYAIALRKNGKEKEAIRLVSEFVTRRAADNPFLQSQVLLFNGRNVEGLHLLDSVDIGWYNLNLCTVNPVFDGVRNDGGYKKFLERNNNRILDNRERISQLETSGFLPRPEDFFVKKYIVSDL